MICLLLKNSQTVTERLRNLGTNFQNIPNYGNYGEKRFPARKALCAALFINKMPSLKSSNVVSKRVKYLLSDLTKRYEARTM